MVAGAVPQIESLDIIQLGTQDVAGTTAFYEHVLGAAVIDPPSAHWARVRLGNIDLGIHARAAVGDQSGHHDNYAGAPDTPDVRDMRVVHEEFARVLPRVKIRTVDLGGSIRLLDG